MPCNGTNFGIRATGLEDQWFTAPAAVHVGSTCQASRASARWGAGLVRQIFEEALVVFAERYDI